MAATRSPLGQHWLIELMQENGYKSTPQGVCFGVSMMAMQAALLNDTDAFNQRIDDLHKAFRGRQTLSTDMLAFLDGVELNQQPWFYPSLFTSNDPLFQTSTLTMKHTQSIALERAGLMALKPFSGGYDKIALRTYLAAFKQTLDEAEKPLTHPFTLVLRSDQHTLLLSYNMADKTWYLVDANGAMTGKALTDSKEVADALFERFHASEKCFFSSSAFATAENGRQALNLLNTWHKLPAVQAIHLISPFTVNDADQQGSSRLLVAILAQNLEEVEALLNGGANPNLNHRSLGPALSVATLTGNGKIIAALLAAGAAIEARDKQHETPLLTAARVGNVDAVTTLLAAGADVSTNKETIEGYENALYLAILNEKYAVAEKLLLAGANPNIPCTNRGITPLKLAAWTGQAEGVKLLLAHGANPLAASTPHSFETILDFTQRIQQTCCAELMTASLNTPTLAYQKGTKVN